MPIIHAHFWEGIGEGKAKTVIQNITKIIIEMGIPAQAVEVLVHEVPKTHWGIGGEVSSERFKDASPPE
ncbi:MAG: tautomerase family protein [bacterium]